MISDPTLQQIPAPRSGRLYLNYVIKVLLMTVLPGSYTKALNSLRDPFNNSAPGCVHRLSINLQIIWRVISELARIATKCLTAQPSRL